jgi:ABC-type sugar transport system ATPase subunit
LRPSDIHVTSGEGSLRGRVLLAERLGRNIELTVEVGGAQLIVLTSGRHGVGEGDEVTMTIADTDVHLFAALGQEHSDLGNAAGEGDTRRLSSDTKNLEAAQ